MELFLSWQLRSWIVLTSAMALRVYKVSIIYSCFCKNFHYRVSLKKKSARQLHSESYLPYLTKSFMFMQQPSHRKYSAFFKSNFSVSHLQTYTKQAFQSQEKKKNRRSIPLCGKEDKWRRQTWVWSGNRLPMPRWYVHILSIVKFKLPSS